MRNLLIFLERLVYAAFQVKKRTDNENLSMRGLVITEKEIEQSFGLFKKNICLPDEELLFLQRIKEKIVREEQESDEESAFVTLCRRFGLNNLECLALLLGVAPFYDRKFEKIYGYLQDQVEEHAPTRGLCISLAELLGEVSEEEETDFLMRSGNLELLLEEPKGDPKGLAELYQVSARTIAYLQDTIEAPVCLKENLKYFTWRQEIDEIEIREDYLERLEKIFIKRSAKTGETSGMIFLHGRKGIGKKYLLKQLAVRQELRLLFFDISNLIYASEADIKRVMSALFTESVLIDASICLTGGDLEQEIEEERIQRRRDRRKQVLSFLEQYGTTFFLLAEEKEEQLADFSGEKICIELPALSAGEKICLWKAYSRGYALADDVDLDQNGNKYILTPQGIKDTLASAQLLAAGEGEELIWQRHIWAAVRQNQKSQLGAYATLINSRFVWDDLILGEEQKQQMRIVCNQLKYRDVVGEQWGFHKKTPYGRGLSVLFYGPPGTGKTMAAQVMANELGLDLYRIDISQMVSKYIGETQKNISGLFQKAKDINAILFFDEADSLFAKRSEAKDSHDRNANAETAHLLQKLEDYEGIAILATNYLNNIDDAFKRRLKFIIHIAFPDVKERLYLWKTTLPKEARCEEELDFEFFAEHFELSGSSIKEILTNAAYLAASEYRGLINRDLVEAVKLNYAKYGKILTKKDFEYLG